MLLDISGLYSYFDKDDSFHDKAVGQFLKCLFLFLTPSNNFSDIKVNFDGYSDLINSTFSAQFWR